MLALASAVAAAAIAGCGGEDSGDDQLSNAGNDELLSSSGFESAYDAAVDKAGDDAQVLRVQVSADGASFRVLDEGLPAAFIYTGGEIVDQEFQVVGGASFEDQAFSIAEIDPGAIDRIAEGARAESGDDALELTQLTFARRADGELRWLASAAGQVFSADPAGVEVSSGDVSTASDCAVQTGEQADAAACGP
jgi:hypothetical protein